MKPASKIRVNPPAPGETGGPAPRAGGGFGQQARRWARRLLATGAALVALVAALAAGVYAYFDRDLPSAQALQSYRPPQVTKAYCVDGSLCAEYFHQRRTLVPVDSLPAHVKNAFLAAEDADFYRHEGLDYLGMLRVAVKTVLFGARPTGASTITQ